MNRPDDTRKKAFILAALVGSIALLHYITPTEPHNYHVIHIALRKLYFLPPVVAAAWFGLRGAIVTTAAVSLLFTFHAILDWPGNYMEQANQMGELASFCVVGLVSGTVNSNFISPMSTQLRKMMDSPSATCLPHSGGHDGGTAGGRNGGMM